MRTISQYANSGSFIVHYSVTDSNNQPRSQLKANIWYLVAILVAFTRFFQSLIKICMRLEVPIF